MKIFTFNEIPTLKREDKEVIEFLTGGGRDNSELLPLQLTVAEKNDLKVFLEEGLTGAHTPFIYPKIP